jgi:cell wall-associated NlpC family hydrolase
VKRTLHRTVAALSAVAVAATFGATTAAGNPGPANPPKADVKLSHRIGAVNAELDRLSRRNDRLDEQYNLAVAAVTSAQRTARRAQHAAAQAAARYRAAHVQFVQAVTEQYESGPSVAVGELLASAAPQQYLDGLTMNTYLAGQFASTVSAVQTLRADAADAAQRAHDALAGARAKRADLAKRRAAIQAQARRFHQLLDSLTARQQRELANQTEAVNAQPQFAADQAPTAHARITPVSGPVSGDVQRVIAFAEAQVGKWYSYGAAGPSAYDCSGLTMTSYAQIGISLPHSSAEQYNYGTHVAYSQLQPGDLIFLYSPIGHVELYVGHDLAVSAANPATGIVYVHPSQDMGNYTGATRLVH